MIHIEFGPSTIVGIGLAIVGILLYILRTKRPGISRDYDLFFSSIGLLCGGILMFQGWRLDPILLLCQLLSSGTAIFFIAESVWLRNRKIPKKKYMTLNPQSILWPNNSNKMSFFSFLKTKVFYKKQKIVSIINTNTHCNTVYQTHPIDYIYESRHSIKINSID
jgi:hypothetical protein